MGTNTSSVRKTIRSLIAASSVAQQTLPPAGCVRPFNATRARADADALDLLTDAMFARIARVPADAELWGVEECAQHLGIEPAAFQRLRYGPGFPSACAMSGTPLWLATRVIEWKDLQRKKAPPRGRKAT